MEVIKRFKEPEFKLNIKKDSNWTRTQNHLVRKRTLSHFAKRTVSGNYRMWIHSETRMWHDKNIQSINKDD